VAFRSDSLGKSTLSITELVFSVSVMEASVEDSNAEARRNLVPVSVVDKSIDQPFAHPPLDLLIDVAIGCLLYECLVAMNENTSEDTGKDVSVRRVFVDLVDTVNMLRTTALQELDELINKRIDDVASEEELVSEGCYGFQ